LTAEPDLSQTLTVELIKWSQEQQQRYQQSLIAVEPATRDQINRKECDRSVDHCEKMKRPIRNRENRKPRCNNHRSQRRVFVTRCELLTPEKCLDQILMEADGHVRENLKAGPHGNEQDQEPCNRSVVI